MGGDKATDDAPSNKSGIFTKFGKMFADLFFSRSDQDFTDIAAINPEPTSIQKRNIVFEKLGKDQNLKGIIATDEPEVSQSAAVSQDEQDDKMTYDQWMHHRMTQAGRFDPKTQRFSNRGVYSEESEKKYADYVERQNQGIPSDVEKGFRGEYQDGIRKHNQAMFSNAADSDVLEEVVQKDDGKKKSVRFNEDENQVRLYDPEVGEEKGIIAETKGLRGQEVTSYRDLVRAQSQNSQKENGGR